MVERIDSIWKWLLSFSPPPTVNGTKNQLLHAKWGQIISSSFLFKLATYPKMEKFTTQTALFHIPTSGRLYLEHTHQKSCLAFIYFLANFRLDMSSHIFHSFSTKDTRSKTVPALHFTPWVEVLFLKEHFHLHANVSF